MMDIWSAWLAVLFRRLGVGECRISFREIAEGLGKLQFSAERDEYGYVIRLTEEEAQEETNGGEQEKI